jgi:hypothetical protein
MKITHKDNYIVLKPEEQDIAEFVKYLTINHSDFKMDNIVIDIIKSDALSQQELLLFLKISKIHRHQKKSFVIVNDSINLDGIPEELTLVPTLLEAVDIIGMEELERELGF